MSDLQPTEREPGPEPGPGPAAAPEGAAERLAALWQHGRRPALAGFLAEAGPLAPAELAAVLRVDQRRRWEIGERIPAESYLSAYPALREEPEAALDLIYAEYLLRERRGERPELDEFLGRFPDHRDSLKPQIELHLALGRPTSGDPDEFTQVGSPEAPTLRPWPDGSDSRDLPRELGRYRIEGLLGQGGMGRVYRAFDTKLGRSVALKMPHIGRDTDGVAIHRFHREARVASTFNHPNLCPVFDLGEHAGTVYLTMPLLAGETLAARLAREGPLPEPEAARLASRIARAMQVAHDAGVLHRDLKPANVMIDPGGEPIVMDFGLARRLNIDDVYTTSPGVLVGTLAYVSPEQVGGDPSALGPSCDIYSLGVMLSEMLAGRVPFQGRSHAMLAQILARKPDPPSNHRPGLDRRLEGIAMRAMAEPGESSFASMADLAWALDDWLRSDLRDPRSPAPAAKVSKPGSEPPRPLPTAPLDRRRWARSSALLALAAVLAGLAWAGLTARSRAARESGALLTAGSRWTGSFRFRPPITDYTGNVEVVVIERRADSFRGIYTTESGAYQWEIAGSVRGSAIRWEFTRAIRDNNEHNVVGKAYVEGRITGPDLRVVFYQPGEGDADMELHRKP